MADENVEMKEENMNAASQEMLQAAKTNLVVAERERHSSTRRYVVSVQTRQRLIIRIQMDSSALQQNAVRFFHAALLVHVLSTRRNLQ